MFLTQLGYSKPRYWDVEVTKVGRKYFEITGAGFNNLKFEITQKIKNKYDELYKLQKQNTNTNDKSI